MDSGSRSSAGGAAAGWLAQQCSCSLIKKLSSLLETVLPVLKLSIALNLTTRQMFTSRLCVIRLSCATSQMCDTRKQCMPTMNGMFVYKCDGSLVEDTQVFFFI